MKSSAVKFCAILLIMLSSVVVHTDCCSSRSMPKSRPRPVPHFRGVMTSATTTFTVIRPDATSSSNREPPDTVSTGMDSRPTGGSGGNTDAGGPGRGISSTSTGNPANKANGGGRDDPAPGGSGVRVGNAKDQLLMRMGKCSQLFEENYCLNGGKCYNFTIANSTMPTCECADGFMGERCESKYLDGTYLSMRKPKIHIETASMYYGAFLAMMVVLAVFYYLHWLNHCR
ncbi:protein gurken-like [Anopheles maculipalpis]|uniref:protein gurken-like n=1 Tax=Anopheles maculipalpis TaxID=1496333 RepID=UPI002158EC72|nr:protein gurken-like [Anopheles maculipalpis]XP_050072257.1 protein gurken-like [Anopheles maculipalpis]